MLFVLKFFKYNIEEEKIYDEFRYINADNATEFIDVLKEYAYDESVNNLYERFNYMISESMTIDSFEDMLEEYILKQEFSEYIEPIVIKDYHRTLEISIEPVLSLSKPRKKSKYALVFQKKSIQKVIKTWNYYPDYDEVEYIISAWKEKQNINEDVFFIHICIDTDKYFIENGNILKFVNI